MAGADTTSDVLVHAGFEEVQLRRCDLPIWMGSDPSRAVEVVLALGPAGELVRLNGQAAEPFRARIEAELHELMAGFTGPEGVSAPSSTWIVTAVNPASA